MSTLTLDGVGVERDGRWLLRDASLTLTPGTLTALLGPNAAGKSTLLRVAAGLWHPDRGTVTIDGRALATLPRRELARRIAMVPQRAGTTFNFSVRQLVAMGRYAHEGRSLGPKSEHHPAVEAALAATDLEPIASRAVTTLSGGELQRVLIARCLTTEAKIIILDEPTASLDVRHALEVMRLCRSLAERGHAILIALHDLNAAARYATRVGLVHHGQLERQGSADAVLTAGAISDVFGVDVEQLRSSEGHPVFAWRDR